MTEPGAPATMCHAFQATVASHPGEMALRALGGAVTISWLEYAVRVRQIAAGLAGRGVCRGDTVALMIASWPDPSRRAAAASTGSRSPRPPVLATTA